MGTGSTIDPDKCRLPSGFVCHNTLVGGLAKIFAGMYDMDLSPPPATILDVGGNAGAFSLWALGRWPEAHITVYEPSASTSRHLFMNLKPELNHPRVKIHVKAISSADAKYVTLWDGASNTGERSLHHGPDQTSACESVETEHPKNVAPAEFVKLDCEGSELDFLRHYPHLGTVRALAMEWHVPQQLPEMIDILARAGLKLCANDRAERLLKFARVTV